ncbi:MAG: GNAT family N-acetyltransferase [Paracoccaceae bacterium]
MIPPVIETARLRLRGPGPEDLPAWTAFLGSPRARHVGGPIPADRAWRIFASVIGHWTLRGYGSWTLEPGRGGAPLGMVGLWHPAGWPEPELAYTLWSAEAEGKGYASEAVSAVLAQIFGPLGWTSVVSFIDPGNARSIRLAERLGARRDPAAVPPDAAHPDLAYRHLAPVGATA